MSTCVRQRVLTIAGIDELTTPVNLYLALLRGINVGGSNVIRMAALRLASKPRASPIDQQGRQSHLSALSGRPPIGT